MIALRDTAGHEGTVDAGDPRWGNALHMSTGTNTPNTHIVLDQIRVPLSEFARQGVDVGSLAGLRFRFGTGSMPKSGSIEMADVRFQESSAGSRILSDGNQADGAGFGPPKLGGPLPATSLRDFESGADTGNKWTVDDDRKQCPDAQFTSIQAAVDYAAPWDTIVVCAGVYQESSTPVNSTSSPVQAGARNGLTINKPLKIKGAGAGEVTIEPDQSLTTLAGDQPYLRDGGGNVITVSRQSLGSTDTSEMFVDISGVTVTSGKVWAEAGIAYFGAAGRVEDSVVGPMRVAGSPEEKAAHPDGWGIVKTGVIEGASSGTVESELTVAGSVVKGYQAGGILFDGARGPDGSPDTIVRTGIRNHGYVTGTVVEGSPASATGIEYTSGVNGSVQDSRITGNQAYGLLLADAGTDLGLTASDNTITGNGFAVYNGDAAIDAVRAGAPIVVSRSYLGPHPSVSGAASVVLSKPLSRPSKAPHAPGRVADSRPTAEVADPGVPIAGKPAHTLIRATDDFAVRSATLLVNGVRTGTDTTAPYDLTWTPHDAGRRVTLQALVVDSSGKPKLSKPVTVTVRRR